VANQFGGEVCGCLQPEKHASADLLLGDHFRNDKWAFVDALIRVDRYFSFVLYTLDHLRSR